MNADGGWLNRQSWLPAAGLNVNGSTEFEPPAHASWQPKSLRRWKPVLRRWPQTLLYGSSEAGRDEQGLLGGCGDCRVDVAQPAWSKGGRAGKLRQLFAAGSVNQLASRASNSCRSPR